MSSNIKQIDIEEAYIKLDNPIDDTYLIPVISQEIITDGKIINKTNIEEQVINNSNYNLIKKYKIIIENFTYITVKTIYYKTINNQRKIIIDEYTYENKDYDEIKEKNYVK